MYFWHIEHTEVYIIFTHVALYMLWNESFTIRFNNQFIKYSWQTYEENSLAENVGTRIEIKTCNKNCTSEIQTLMIHLLVRDAYIYKCLYLINVNMNKGKYFLFHNFNSNLWQHVQTNNQLCLRISSRFFYFIYLEYFISMNQTENSVKFMENWLLLKYRVKTQMGD